MSDANPSILSHISIGTNQFEAACEFYAKVLATLGCKEILRHPGAVAFGREYPEFWVQTPIDGQPATLGNGSHFGFNAPDKESVRAFYQAALAAGARGEGEPGPRAEYGEPYYGCFVRDLDGHKIEATYWDMALVHELYIDPHAH